MTIQRDNMAQRTRSMCGHLIFKCGEVDLLDSDTRAQQFGELCGWISGTESRRGYWQSLSKTKLVNGKDDAFDPKTAFRDPILKQVCMNRVPVFLSSDL